MDMTTNLAVISDEIANIEPLIRELTFGEVMFIGGGECLVNGL